MGPLLGDELLGDEGLVTSSHGRGSWRVRQTPHQSMWRSTRSGSISEVAPLRTHVQARFQPSRKPATYDRLRAARAAARADWSVNPPSGPPNPCGHVGGAPRCKALLPVANGESQLAPPQGQLASVSGWSGDCRILARGECVGASLRSSEGGAGEVAPSASTAGCASSPPRRGVLQTTDGS